MRGLPGSGKTTLARTLSEHVFSTDDFFMKTDGHYDFDGGRLREAHRWNIGRVEQALSDGLDPIVVDNTNIHASDLIPYVVAALANDYSVVLVEPDTAWKEEVDTLFEKNHHDVPRDTLERCLREYEHNITLDDIITSR